MWRSAGSFDPTAARVRRSLDGSAAPAPDGGAAPVRLASAAWVFAALGLLADGASAQTFLTQEEALRLAFPPPAAVERETAFLDAEGLALARRLAGDAELESGIVTYYVGRNGEQVLGYAYFDVHRVRTLPEVLMVVVTPAGAVDRVEVLKFSEPREYLAPERWLAQFEGRPLGPKLSTKGGIVNITGGTLTSRAVTRAVRRVLALHAVIRGETGP